MSFTRADTEAATVRAVGVTVLAAAGMATTMAGSAAPNADLNDPLLRALDHFGLSATDPTNVSDVDVAQVQQGDLVRFLDYVRIMATQVVLIHLQTRPRIQQWEDYRSDLGDNFIKNLGGLLDSLWADYRRRYLYSGAPAVGKLCPESRNQLNTAPYFPPYPPAPANPAWPFGPIS